MQAGALKGKGDVDTLLTIAREVRGAGLWGRRAAVCDAKDSATRLGPTVRPLSRRLSRPSRTGRASIIDELLRSGLCLNPHWSVSSYQIDPLRQGGRQLDLVLLGPHLWPWTRSGLLGMKTMHGRFQWNQLADLWCVYVFKGPDR